MPESNADAQTPPPGIDKRCPVCDARPGRVCQNTINAGQPLPGRRSHYARTER